MGVKASASASAAAQMLHQGHPDYIRVTWTTSASPTLHQSHPDYSTTQQYEPQAAPPVPCRASGHDGCGPHPSSESLNARGFGFPGWGSGVTEPVQPCTAPPFSDHSTYTGCPPHRLRINLIVIRILR